MHYAGMLLSRTVRSVTFGRHRGRLLDWCHRWFSWRLSFNAALKHTANSHTSLYRCSLLPIPHPSMRGISSRYQVHIWCGKTRMAGLQSGEGRMMIDSVVWAQYINVTDTLTTTHCMRSSCNDNKSTLTIDCLHNIRRWLEKICLHAFNNNNNNSYYYYSSGPRCWCSVLTLFCCVTLCRPLTARTECTL